MIHFNTEIEYSWNQFKELFGIRQLPLSEQVQQYHYYLDQLANQRINQNKGRNPFEEETGYVLLETGFFLLQENGDRILL